MKTVSLYEQAGILVPGSLFLCGVALLLPAGRTVFSLPNVSVGGLGVFVLLAYAAGHFVAAVGNAIEFLFWSACGGMPSTWITRQESRILTSDQVLRLQTLLSRRLGFADVALNGMDEKKWSPIFGQLYRDVLATTPGRVESFNGSYGLNRGLTAAAACLVLVALFCLDGPEAARAAAALFIACLVYLYRMYRFGVHFAREVFFGFLNPALDRAAPTTHDQLNASDSPIVARTGKD